MPDLRPQQRPLTERFMEAVRKRIPIGVGDKERQRLKDLTEQLAIADQTYRDLYEHSPAPQCSVDLKTGRVLMCNETLAGLLGYTKDQILGMHLHELYAPHCREVVRCSTSKGTPALSNQPLELLRKDGTAVRVLSYANTARKPPATRTRTLWVVICGPLEDERTTCPDMKT